MYKNNNKSLEFEALGHPFLYNIYIYVQISLIDCLHLCRMIRITMCIYAKVIIWKIYLVGKNTGVLLWNNN